MCMNNVFKLLLMISVLVFMTYFQISCTNKLSKVRKCIGNHCYACLQMMLVALLLYVCNYNLECLFLEQVII